jgi:Tol biopolymer transport system component
MELVEGPTLADRIARGAVPLDEALPIAKQIAEALEFAHDRGIIHRDLKPANIKLTAEGKVKVLDFGLAKALDDAPGAADIATSPTMTAAATRAGIILGTAAYMSPEQAKGKSADRRADIWAFGVVLFEVLVGKPLYAGETVSETLAQVIMQVPNLDALPASTPARVRELLRRCLTREPAQRLQAIGEARIAIEEAQSGKTEELPVVAAAAETVAGHSLKYWWVLAGGIVFGAALMALALVKFLPTRELPLVKFEVPVGKLEGWPVLSPDGRRVVYTSDGRLWLRDLAALEARELPGTEGAGLMFWSPDSAFVGYMKDNKFWKIAASGGQAAMIGDAGGSFVGHAGACWGENGVIVFSRGNTGLFEISANGGDPRVLLEPDRAEEQDLHQPHLLPGGKGILFVGHRITTGADSLYVLTGKTRKLLLRLEGQLIEDTVYSPTGHILYRRAGANSGLWAVPFSPSKLEVAGEPFLVAADAGAPSVSASGLLTYLPAMSSSQRLRLVWVNRKGEITGTVGQEQRAIVQPALSPDGSRVAVAAIEEDMDIWSHDVARGTKTRLTFDAARESHPAWSPDGNRVLYFSPNGTKLMSQAADGGGTPQVLTEGGAPNVSRDGKYVVFDRASPKGGTDLWYLELAGEKKPVPFLETPASEFAPKISPDGRLVAYTSDESGSVHVSLKRFPSGEGRWQVSLTGGIWPRWSGEGDRLYYREGNAIMEVEVQTQPAIVLSTPKKLFDSQTTPVFISDPFEYDVTRDGQKFLMVQDLGRETKSTTFTVVQNWFAEFRDKQKK